MIQKVAIIGSGISGLASAKQCLAEGFDPIIFEARDNIGGQWYYQEPDVGSGSPQSSIYWSVTSNSCRDTSCFSDFPTDPARYPEYCSHQFMVQYIREYADRFGLKKLVRLNTKVLSCLPYDNDRWQVTSVNKNGDEVQEIFDALFICTGRNTTPHVPQFDGLDTFQGRVLHSHVYRRPDSFRGKKVALIGLGSSAADIASEVSMQAAQCHLITRRGSWVIPRYILGKTPEAWNNRFSQTMLPFSVSQWLFTQLYHTVVGKLPVEFQPDHGIMEANPTIRSDLVENVRVGRITAHRAGIEKITASGIRLTNGKVLDVDVIILCTGYRIDYATISEKFYQSEQSEFLESPNSVHLYQSTVPPRYPTLFMMGIFEVTGPIHPAVELQARWASAVLAGRIKLPSTEEMSKAIRISERTRAQHWVKSDRHTLSNQFLHFCDPLARDLGVSPTFGRLLSRVFTSNPLRAISILNAVYFSTVSGAQYRLFGNGSMPDLAAATLLRIAKGGTELNDEEKAALQADGDSGLGLVEL